MSFNLFPLLKLDKLYLLSIV